MLKIYKSQNGFALILVLLTIVIIGILAPPLVNSVISNANQVQTSEEMIQKNKLIDMGKLVARATIEKKLNELTTDVNGAVSELKQFLHDPYVPEPVLSGSQYDSHYKITYLQSEFQYDPNTQILQLPYTITSKLTSKSDPSTLIGSELTVREVYKIRLLGGSPGGGSPGSSTIDWQNIKVTDFTNTNLFPNQIPGIHPSGSVTGNTNFLGTVKTKNNSTFTVNGSAVLQYGAHFSNNGTMIITGNFYSKNGTLKLQNNSKIFIGKNAYFNDVNLDLYDNGKKNIGTICVNGMIKGNSVLVSDAKKVASCNDAIGPGVFYVGMSFPDTETVGSDSGGSGPKWSSLGAY